MWMKRLLTFAVTTVLLCLSNLAAQDIPKGVNYKKAPEAVNNLAKASLEQALANSDKMPAQFFNELLVCGPRLWKSLKPSADRTLLEAKPIIMMVQVPEPITAEGKRALTKEQQASLWRSFLDKYPKVKGAQVRKGKADEISYYWATIPFDIEEPFFVIDIGAERFVAHFKVKDDQPSLFWLDLVGDLRSLKP
jgi:hypothetical protein